MPVIIIVIENDIAASFRVLMPVKRQALPVPS